MTMLIPHLEFYRHCSELKLVIPNNDVFSVDDPSSKSYWYHNDCGEFTRLGKRRSQYIRAAFDTEFDLKTIPASSAFFPTLWVLVRRDDGAIHFRHAFWRGDCPYTSKPSSDAAVGSVYAECVRNGGLDAAAVARWFNQYN